MAQKTHIKYDFFLTDKEYFALHALITLTTLGEHLYPAKCIGPKRGYKAIRKLNLPNVYQYVLQISNSFSHY